MIIFFQKVFLDLSNTVNSQGEILQDTIKDINTCFDVMKKDVLENVKREI